MRRTAMWKITSYLPILPCSTYSASRCVRGDPATALTQPNSIMITEEKARLYFGDSDPLGLPLNVNRDSNYYYVSGVFEALPREFPFFC